MWSNRTLRDVFAANGRADLVEEGADTAISGSTAAEWALPGMLTAITDALAAAPTIDTVQLTVGGNDFLAGLSGGGWHTAIEQADLEELTSNLLSDISTIIDHVLALRSDLEVLVSLYDYPRFFGLSLILGACDDTWDDLGQPTPLELNLALIDLEGALLQLADARPRALAVSHRGLMQATFGFPSDGIAPGDLALPGDPSLPSPSEAMFLGIDCIHLTSSGYEAVGQRLWERYYRARFNPLVFADGFESGDLSNW